MLVSFSMLSCLDGILLWMVLIMCEIKRKSSEKLCEMFCSSPLFEMGQRITRGLLHHDTDGFILARLGSTQAAGPLSQHSGQFFWCWWFRHWMLLMGIRGECKALAKAVEMTMRMRILMMMCVCGCECDGTYLLQPTTEQWEVVYQIFSTAFLLAFDIKMCSLTTTQDTHWY